MRCAILPVHTGGDGVCRLGIALAHKQHYCALLACLPCAKPHFPRYNAKLTTKRAGTNRPFFLVACFSSSKLSEKVSGGYRVFCFSGIELNTWHCSKSLNKL